MYSHEKTSHPSFFSIVLSYQSKKIMKKKLLSKLAIALLLISAITAKAQVVLNETFDYPEGNLVGQGSWVQVGTGASAALNPIQVGSTVLSYPNYVTTPAGKSIVLGDNGQDVMFSFGEQTTGNVYLACIVNFSDAQDITGEYFLAMSRNANTVLNAGRVYVRQSENGIQFGVSRSAEIANAVWAHEEYALNIPHLVVLKYEIIEGTPNDKVSLFIDPIISEKEPTPTAISFSETSTDRNPGAVHIRQGQTQKSPLGNLAHLKVTTSWVSLFDVDPLPANTTPILNVSTMRIVQGANYVGSEYSLIVNLTGEDLTGDIAVTSSNTTELSVTNTITQSLVETTDGYALELILKPTTLGSQTETITLSYGAPKPLVIGITWNALANTSVADISGLRAVTRDGELGNTIYRFLGEAVVTSIKPSGANKTITIQDDNAGILLYVGSSYSSVLNLKVGDKISNVVGALANTTGNLRLNVRDNSFSLVSENNVVTPLVVTPAAWLANTDAYDARLLKIEDVTFTTASPTTYVAASAAFAVEDASANVVALSILAGTDIVGTTRPESTEALDVIGISTLTGGATIEPRSLADIIVKNGSSIVDDEIGAYKVWTYGSTVKVEAVADASVVVYNIAGVRVSDQKVSNGEVSFTLPQGVYLVTVSSASGSSTTKVIIK